MRNMGLDFKAPPQDDVRQWMKVEILFRRGFAFHSRGCGPGARPATLRDVEAFLAENRLISEGERLLRTIAETADRRGRKRQRLPGEATAEHPLAGDARKLWAPNEAARIAASLLRKQRKGAR